MSTIKYIYIFEKIRKNTSGETDLQKELSIPKVQNMVFCSAGIYLVHSMGQVLNKIEKQNQKQTLSQGA